MSKRKKSKGFKFLTVFAILAVLAGGGFGGYYYYSKILVSPIPVVENISINDKNELVVKYSVDNKRKYKDIYCLFNNDGVTPDANDKNWKLAENNECSTLLEDKTYYAYLKNHDGKVTVIENASEYGKITKLEANKEIIYIAKNGTYNLSAKSEKIGNVTGVLKWLSDDESIAKVDENGKVTGLKVGKTKITAQINDVKDEVEVLVTDLITVRPKSYNYNKPYLTCGVYDKEENDLMDKILKDRINDAGYKTRAGAVEAARFLSMEFPYRIRYFSENGREATNGVQGEGRYYNEGLYLDPSRYVNIKKPLRGPKPWGCQLWSDPSEGYRANGLDCSGYISWVMLNGGFDVQDVGAGLASHLDLTDYGERVRFTDEVLNSGKVKVGDLLSSTGPEGGHIAIIAGMDDNFIYVSESLWTPPNVSVTMVAYPKTSAIKKSSGSSYEVVNDRYYWVMLMDSYYKEDGNLTNMWY